MESSGLRPARLLSLIKCFPKCFTWLVEEVASPISMMGPEKISAGYPSYFSCWPVLLGFLVFPQLEQRVSILSYFRRSADDKMWRREVDAQLRLGGSLNPVQPPDPGFLPSGPTSGVSRPQSSSPTMGTECWHDARLTHDTHLRCILSVSSSSLSQVQDRAVSLKL